jgi:hypothetical protein
LASQGLYIFPKACSSQRKHAAVQKSSVLPSNAFLTADQARPFKNPAKKSVRLRLKQKNRQELGKLGWIRTVFGIKNIHNCVWLSFNLDLVYCACFDLFKQVY